MSATLTGISSMATRGLLAELARTYLQQHGVAVQIEATGGVDAAKRVLAGDVFDVVVLASDAIERLIAAGWVLPGSRVDLVRSGVAVAVRAGAARPDISSETALRRVVLAAASIGLSTGPSGVQLAQLFERWGIAEQIQARTVVAPPGVPVGALVARGEVALGFQQLSELIPLDGINIVGPLPAEVQITTTFSAGLCSVSTQPQAARALLGFLASPETSDAKLRHGMTPA
jgi:molybdate transport system substrate-binding protein